MENNQIRMTDFHHDIQRWISQTRHRSKITEAGAVDGHPDTYFIRFDLTDTAFMVSEQMDLFPKAWRIISVYTDHSLGITFIFRGRGGRKRGIVPQKRIDP